MAHLTKQQTERIRNEIIQRGISQPDLETDLLDHICSAVEDHMASGDSFELSFALVMSNFQQYELKKIQERTQALLSGKKIFYPNILQSAGLLLLLFILLMMTGLIVNPIIQFHKDSIGQYVILIRNFQLFGCLLLVIAIAKNELKVGSFTKVDIFPVTPFPLSIIFYIVPIIFLSSIWIEVIDSFIPRPESVIIFMDHHLSQVASSPVILLLPIVILWPLLSEILFRGIILKGMLRKYTPFQAILFSSLFYAASVFNPYNALPLFITGLFCGWLFYRTNSLLPSFLVLTIGQLTQLVYILWTKPLHLAQLMIWKNLLANDTLYYGLGVFSFVITLLLIWMMKKIFDRQLAFSEFSLE